MNFVIEGPLHPINVKLRSKNYISKLWSKSKDQEIDGLFDPTLNTIYVANSLTPDQKLHTLMHEIVHAMDEQLSWMGDEAKADVIGSYLIRLFKLDSIRQILK